MENGLRGNFTCAKSIRSRTPSVDPSNRLSSPWCPPTAGLNDRASTTADSIDVVSDEVRPVLPVAMAQPEHVAGAAEQMALNTPSSAGPTNESKGTSSLRVRCP